ncbi:comF family protein [Onishia taeanensis]|uniref:ComF family protein n=1 Tax=Onishia taeanensis TaxID=284577 RepID=A0A1G7TWQ8_9GAMM|nr:comF family protein [Halomonas taeanensis]
MIGAATLLSTGWLSVVDRWLRFALPGHCVFCLGEPPGGAHWCAACAATLPWNTLACVGCAEPMAETLASGRRWLDGDIRCGACLTRPPAFDSAWVPLRYEQEVMRLVQAFKFSASPRAGTLLLALIEAGLAARHDESSASATTQGGMAPAVGSLPGAVIPVPLHPLRARERGFDQADWLGRRLARRLGVPCMTAQRIRMTPTQRGLSRKARRANLRNAFTIERPLPAHVVLLDDVMTTGATFEALAKACRAAGAQRIEAWAVARTPMT